MTSVAVLTPWFPNRPGDQGGAFIADSASAVMRAGWHAGVLVARPYLPRWLQRLGHDMIRGDIDVAAFNLSALEVIRVPTLPHSMLRPLTNTLTDKMIAASLELMVRSVSACVIHAQTEGSAPIAAKVALRLRLPLVVTLHGINMHSRYLHNWYWKRRLRPALTSADCVILVGEPLRAFFQGYLGSDKNFQVVPNGVDLPPVKLDNPIMMSEQRRLVSVANLHEGKGIDLTLRALARLYREGISNWTYRIIGEGQEKASWLQLAADLGIADKVSFVGPIRHSEIFESLARHDIFVLPSYREAFGIAYLEAMAAGLLTIGVMGQGPSQFIRNGANGILVPPRDVDALVSALRDIFISDGTRYREIASKGQRTVQNSYTWDNHAKQLIAVYQNVINARKSALASDSTRKLIARRQQRHV